MKNQRDIGILFCDTLRPVYLALATFLCLLWLWRIKWPTDPKELLSAALTVGSVVIGFMVSAKAIIISSSSRPTERLREMGMMIELTDRFSLAINMSMFFTVVSTCGFFDVNGRIFEALWAASGVGMLYSFRRVSSLLFRLVRD